ncbi:MAG: response regulator transcription factor [Actinobacteria bacterium]|nr:response regulator transcription factor [Actinomycetota bacterium]
MKTTTIIIADDHKVFRQGLRSLLCSSEEIQVIGEAENGLEAVELCDELDADIIIMDIGMPEMNGLLAVKELTRRKQRTRAVILSTHLKKSYVVEALKSGAKGYVLKDSAFEDVVAAIEAVIDGETYLSPRVTSLAIGSILAEEELSGNQLDTLSCREQEVMQLVVEGKTNKEIAETLFISPKTVDNHRASIMRKLDVHDVASLVKYSIRAGFTEL